MVSDILIWLLIVPLIASLAAVLARWLRGAVGSVLETVHMLSVVIVLALVLVVAGYVLVYGEVTALNQWLRVDAMGAIFVVIVGLVGFLAGLYSIGYTRHDIEIGQMDRNQLTTYYSLFHFFFFTMLLAVTSNNIIIMWVAIEATTLSSAFLVGLYGTRPALEAAWKYVVICTVGVAFGLYGTILVYSDAVNVLPESSMASLWSEIVQYAGALDPTLLKLAFVFVLIGFGTKAGIFPMYTWLPDTYSEAPSPVSAMLSGVLVNCTLFVVIRFSIIVNLSLGPTFTQTLFLIFGVLSLGTAVFFMLGQRDINRLLAYSSPENIGLILVAFGLGGPLGVPAGFLQLINHSLVKSMMFFLSGNVLMKYRSRSLDVVKGLMQAAPVTAVFLLGGAFALVGVPPFNIFLSKFMIVSAGMATGRVWLMTGCLLLLMLAFVAMFRMLGTVVQGQKPDNISKGETGWTTLAPIMILMVLVLALGLSMPAPLVSLLNGATQVVNVGVPTAQATASGLTAGSLFAPLELANSGSVVPLFRVQVP
ncbi:MAG TPA: hydrogenase 4 subunit F [Anaerolineales bacterium]|nr:hydrogenase 4 subunit F [Anaerolineales bacterium]